MIKKIIYYLYREMEKKRRLKKYIGYNIASNGENMRKYAEWIKGHVGENIHNIFEIGANYAQDAEVLAEEFNVLPDEIYVFEAHPDICKTIKKIHKFHAYNNAVYNEKKEMSFNICDVKSENTGMSSLLDSNKTAYNKTGIVQAIRMDDFMYENDIKEIDFVKIDVEGCNYEVLEGFGNRIKDIHCIQIEADHIENWKGEHLWRDIYKMLVHSGFELVLFDRQYTQSDSLWINKLFWEKYTNIFNEKEQL